MRGWVPFEVGVASDSFGGLRALFVFPHRKPRQAPEVSELEAFGGADWDDAPG